MIKAEYPNTFADLGQVNSYLYQLAEKINLNFANTTAEAIWNETAKALDVLNDKEASAKEKADILASYSAMRSLIIKTADYTVENSEKIRLSMSGDYLAKSDFGEYFEKATVDIEGTPVGITQLYGYTSGITGDFGDITVDSHNFIKTGLLYYDDNSLPVYGVGVGELATKVDANGHTVLDRSNLLATYTADEIAFWQNSKKVAYINNGKMYMPAANATFESLDCTNATVIGLVVGKNVSMGPDAVISWGNVNNKPTNLATTDDIPTKTSQLTNNSGFAYTTDIPDVSSFITEETATQITKNTVTSTYIEAMKLTVGKEILMGPDAVISWGNVNNKPTNLATTDDIPTKTSQLTNNSGFAYTTDIPTKVEDLSDGTEYAKTSVVTTITQNAIQTGTLHLGGSIYRVVGENWWNSAEHLLLGVNNYGNLQVGSPSTKADYDNLNLYAQNNIYLVPGGESISDGDWSMVVRGPSSTSGQGALVKGVFSITGMASGVTDSDKDTGTHRLVVVGIDGRLHASSTTLSTLADGSLKTTAVFG